jgi:hypothetical protein
MSETKWEINKQYRFLARMFGAVELVDFYKSGPTEFTLTLDLLTPEFFPSTPPRVVWHNCHYTTAQEIFGIDIEEQSMWGEQ